MSMNLGRTWRITRNISRHRPERLPSMPAPLPAVLRSWHDSREPAGDHIDVLREFLHHLLGLRPVVLVPIVMALLT